MERKPDAKEDKNLKDKLGEEKTIVSELPKEVQDDGEPGELKKGLLIGTSSFLIIFVVIISVIVTMMMQRQDWSEGSTDDTSTVDDVVNNTELSSGGVSLIVDGKSIEYAGAYVVDGIEATITSGTFESINDNEAVFLVVNGGTLRIDGDVIVNKSGSEDFVGRGDDYSFYGLNSAIVVVGEESSAFVDGAKINTNVSGANAVVAVNGGRVVIENSEITTTRDNSRGLHATFSGSIHADGVKISTQGGSCAALATDRGAGEVVANNMTLSTAGAGSPLIYSTGEITVTNSTGKATGAQIAVVEGKNSINLQGSEFSANGNGNRGSVDNAGVMIYQSMSGDADEGTGSFTATDCTLSVAADSDVYNGVPFFFVTNTDATIDLTGVTISFSDDQNFIVASGTDEWGWSGLNGGRVTLTMSDVTATNTMVEVDSISSISGI